jgi:hypothetical protein|tara:strand:+ start:12729 stop:14645 length:1917 start_codon:yes stop_codon:yes gene_type:complete
MAVTENLYTGDGSTVLYSFTFPYLATTDVKVSLNGSDTTAYSLANATQVQLNTAPASGVAIRVYRDTSDASLTAEFFPGAAIKSTDLNNNFTQNLYVTQESNDIAEKATTTANTAKSTADSATTTANGAVTTANAASASAASAVTTANTASTNATNAVNTANTASTNATSAVNTANTASTNASTALSTANTANTNATTALNNSRESDGAGGFTSAISKANTAITTANTASSTATTASTNASSAVTTANAASATATAAQNAVNAVVLYDAVTNVSSIPGSPSDGDRIEVANSTGIESFTPLAGIPSGFTGNSQLAVRLNYTSSGSTWNWVDYRAPDPDARYFTKSAGDTNTTNISTNTTNIATKMPLAGGTFTGAVNFDDNVVIKGDTTNGSGKLTLNCENNSHGVNIKGPPHSAGATYTLTLPDDTGTNGQALTTNGSGVLSWSSLSAPVASVNGNTGTVVLTASDVGAATTAQGTLAASALQSSDIGVSIQAYDANLPSGSTILVDGDVGVGVQAYDADTAKTDVAQSFTAAQRGSITTLTSGATVTPDFAAANNYTLTLGHNATVANPTNLTAGQSGSIFLVQDGTGSRTAAWGSYWDFAGGTAPTLTTTASAVDRIDYVVRSSTSIHAVATLNYS